MVFGALVLKIPWLNRPLPTFLLLLAFALASAGLGAFLGGLVKTESQASGISSSIGMIFAMLSGAWFPIELFSKVMQNTAKIFPTYWGMQGLNDPHQQQTDCRDTANCRYLAGFCDPVHFAGFDLLQN